VSLSSGARRRVLVVDDDREIVEMTRLILESGGYDVIPALSGEEALRSASNQKPDLILLDINMPEMNGYEVCERLKSSQEVSGIPVIFLSVLGETEDKMKAFRCGAADYISKPFQLEEVMARVETHLKLYGLQRAFQFQNERLEQAVAARTRELAEANQRLRILDTSKNEFLNLISHEFRTPLNGLLGVGEIVLNELATSPESDELREMFEQSRQRILSILDDAMLLTQIDVKRESFLAGPVKLSSAVKRALDLTTELARDRLVGLGPLSCEELIVLGEEDFSKEFLIFLKEKYAVI
jgi:DNA-binding response OmpR family regulator